MSVLPDWKIKQLCSQGMVDPFDPELVNPCSLDIRIGESAKSMNHDGTWRNIDLSSGSQFLLHPGSQLLVSSLETFYIPINICGSFYLKSSRGREFWEHIHAGFIDPGWHGSVLTMELINQSKVPLVFFKGMRIGQIVFQQLIDLPESHYGKTGRYNKDTSVQESRG